MLIYHLLARSHPPLRQPSPFMRSLYHPLFSQLFTWTALHLPFARSHFPLSRPCTWCCGLRGRALLYFKLARTHAPVSRPCIWTILDFSITCSHFLLSRPCLCTLLNIPLDCSHLPLSCPCNWTVLDLPLAIITLKDAINILTDISANVSRQWSRSCLARTCILTSVLVYSRSVNTHGCDPTHQETMANLVRPKSIEKEKLTTTATRRKKGLTGKSKKSA